MEPKTVLQKRVVELSKTLKDITPDQRAWAMKNVLKHVGFRTKAQTNCLDCGHQWKTGNNTLLLTKLQDKCTCPNCDTMLTIKDTRERVTAQRLFYSIIETCKEFQVVRIFELRSVHKTGHAVAPSFMEVASQWVLPNGKYELIARLRGGMGYYNDSFNGYLEIRGKQSFFEKYNIEPDGIYPKMGVLPIFKKHGFKGKFHDLTPHNLFTQLGHSTICETLLKRKEFGFLAALCLGSDTRKKQVNKYWPSIRICMRHGYNVNQKQVCDYLDHLELLEFFNEDMTSPHFVCPANFTQAHQRYIARKQAHNDRVLKEQQRAKIEEENKEYVQKKGIFFGVEIIEGKITISVIKSVQEVYEHGKVLHHCVFTNGYHRKAESLLLSASVNGELAETIEINLNNMQVVQARGLQNKPHQEHAAIVALLNKKLPEIKKVYKKKGDRKVAA